MINWCIAGNSNSFGIFVGPWWIKLNDSVDCDLEETLGPK